MSNRHPRRDFIRSLSRTAAVFTFDQLLAQTPPPTSPGGVQFTNITREAGIARTGWGGGCCVGDFDNDGFDDLFVTYWGDCSLWKNLGNGKFTDVAAKAGVSTRTKSGLRRHNTGCAFVDYNKDGHLDLFVANYIDFDPKTAPLPESGPCKYKGLLVACGPPGLQGGKNILFRNNGPDAKGEVTFTDVAAESGILKTPGTYGLGVIVCDFDNDTWPDIYVANDSTSSTLYKKQSRRYLYRCRHRIRGRLLRRR